MDEIIAKFKKSDKACFCAAALIISNVLSIFTGTLNRSFPP